MSWCSLRWRRSSFCSLGVKSGQRILLCRFGMKWQHRRPFWRSRVWSTSVVMTAEQVLLLRSVISQSMISRSVVSRSVVTPKRGCDNGSHCVPPKWGGECGVRSGTPEERPSLEWRQSGIDKIFNNFKWHRISGQGKDCWFLAWFSTQSKLQFFVTGFNFAWFKHAAVSILLDLQYKSCRELFQLQIKLWITKVGAALKKLCSVKVSFLFNSGYMYLHREVQRVLTFRLDLWIPKNSYACMEVRRLQEGPRKFTQVIK